MEYELPALYQHDRFFAQRQILKLFGGAFRLYAPDGQLMAYSKQKAFKLKEDIRVYADEAMTTELVTIQADRVIDWAASYSVVDTPSGILVGRLRRKGFSALFRDSWEILDTEGNQLATVQEDSGFKAMLRRIHDLANLLMPQTFHIRAGGNEIATMKQNFNWFAPKFEVDLSDDDSSVPRQLLIATVILLLAIEGRQSGG